MPGTTAVNVNSAEAVSVVLLDLVNEFPGLSAGERVQFATIGKNGGIGFFPNVGGMRTNHRENVLGQVQDTCRYPFSIVYNAALNTETQRLRVKEFLDAMGRWLEGQPVTVDGQVYKLEAWPALHPENGANVAVKCQIQSITRLTAAHLNQAYPDGFEDWVFSAELTWRSEYNKITGKG